MIMLRVGIQEKPPLLQMYILPSGPSAAPLGPPAICATTSLRPSGQTRVSRRPRISTSTTDPSGITTGPSGNSRSVASTRMFDIGRSPANELQACSPTAFACMQIVMRPVMAKHTGLAKQPAGKAAHRVRNAALLRHWRADHQRVCRLTKLQRIGSYFTPSLALSLAPSLALSLAAGVGASFAAGASAF